MTVSTTDKSFVMIVGPVAIGKSTIMNRVVQLDHRFGRVSGFTTRDPRPNDEPGMYRYITPEAFNVMEHTSSIVQYVIHPTTGAVYGTELHDYSKEYNLLDMLAGEVEPSMKLPFRDHIAMTVYTQPDAWLRWLTARYPDKSVERDKRLEEANLSVEWSLKQKNHYWIYNDPTSIDVAAHMVINASRGDARSITPPDEAHAMLAVAKSLLS